MSLAYDFDMFSIIPDDVQSEFQGMFNELGISPQMTQQVALFRDPKVPAALRQADDEIRQMFLDSGFGLNTYDSGAPAGRFPAMDENARNACMSRLAEKMKALDRSVPYNMGGFDLLQFINDFEAAQPMDQVELVMYQNAQMDMASRPTLVQRLTGVALASTGLMLGVVILGMMFA